MGYSTMDKRTEKQLRSELKKNATSLHILSSNDILTIWSKQTKNPIESIIDIAKKGASYVSPILDTITVAKLAKDIGIKGQIATKIVQGKQYIIFKGYAGLRSIFTGTRYLATNPRIIDMAIGSMGVGKTILKGTRLTIIITIPINIFNLIIKDDMTMQKFIGTTASDLAKIAASSVAASGAAYIAGAITTVAAGPLVAAIAVGIVVGIALNYIDDRYGLTDALIKKIEELWECGYFCKAGKAMHQIEKSMIQRALNRQPIGRGIFY